MRDNLETYRIWAPEDSVWAQWAKPVLFLHQPINSNISMELTNQTWNLSTDHHTMVILDLPGHSGVVESLSLARLGYRPVPLYNGVNGPSSSIIKVTDIVRALYQGADELITCPIQPDAPPVFMLDSNRMTSGGKRPGIYDNRWCVFPQDMPSASFLIKEGITKIILRSNSIQNDLSHILRRYQEQGIEIFLSNEKEGEKKVTVVKPSRYKSLFYRCLTMFGLTRNSTGGFGAMIPEPTQSSSGRHYGFG
jgi:hypothetical protein